MPWFRFIFIHCVQYEFLLPNNLPSSVLGNFPELFYTGLLPFMFTVYSFWDSYCSGLGPPGSGFQFSYLFFPIFHLFVFMLCTLGDFLSSSRPSVDWKQISDSMSLNFKSSFSLFFSEYVFFIAVYSYFMDAVSQ